MADSAVSNGIPKEIRNDDSPAQVMETPAAPARTSTKKKFGKRKGPNYAHIHRNSLPLEVHSLPAFHPSNPVSLLRLAYVYLTQVAFPPTSHRPDLYIGYFSPDTRSIHVTDPAHVRALWEMGFFGKGTLSRSEPTWLDRERTRLMAQKQGVRTAEEATKARREERRMFKLERARAEREKIERQKLIEEGKLKGGDARPEAVASDEANLATTDGLPLETQSLAKAHLSEVAPAVNEVPTPNSRLANTGALLVSSDAIGVRDAVADLSEAEAAIEHSDIDNEEHLQLTLEEAFFLKYSLGVLEVRPAPLNNLDIELPTTNADLLTLFRQHSVFPPLPLSALGPDDQFLLNYVVYHHFRSLGWVVRPGVKFSVDYLLYNRGPVFSHAEFAVLILPSYSAPYWATNEGKARRRSKEQKDWWWAHCINRVQSQVKKSLVLCYVDVPAPQQDGPVTQDIGRLLRAYKVREFVIRRWLMNRSRD